MKYYEMHEKVYQDLKNDGVLSWDGDRTFAQLWQHGTNVYLHKFLNIEQRSLAELSILDLGTGAGTAALYFAKHGADLVGVDVSSAAIEMANQNAQKLNLKIDFFSADITTLSLDKKFDVVIDSTLLHCLIDADRTAFYSVAKNHLALNGYIFINTMVANEFMAERFNNEYFVYRDKILWSLGMSEVTGRRTIDGKSYFPHRTILSLEEQFTEFESHGLKVAHSELQQVDKHVTLAALLKI